MGVGERRRETLCVAFNGTLLDAARCDPDTRPDSVDGCQHDACVTMWTTSSWSKVLHQVVVALITKLISHLKQSIELISSLRVFGLVYIVCSSISSILFQFSFVVDVICYISYTCAFVISSSGDGTSATRRQRRGTVVESLYSKDLIVFSCRENLLRFALLSSSLPYLFHPTAVVADTKCISFPALCFFICPSHALLAEYVKKSSS